MVTKEKFLEWEIVKIINKQVMYEELGSAAPRSVITCSPLSWDDVSGKAEALCFKQRQNMSK